MNRHSPSAARVLAFVVAMLICEWACADKPQWAERGKGRDREERSHRDRDDRHENARKHFDDQRRAAVRDYYADQFRGGRCPPGLAKKRNGCMPPGQAKKWRVGRPLPRGVVYYELPPPLIQRIGPPPAGYRYVRVAGDILLIAIGTAMVIDAIQDLGGR